MKPFVTYTQILKSDIFSISFQNITIPRFQNTALKKLMQHHFIICILSIIHTRPHKTRSSSTILLLQIYLKCSPQPPASICPHKISNFLLSHQILSHLFASIHYPTEQNSAPAHIAQSTRFSCFHKHKWLPPTGTPIQKETHVKPANLVKRANLHKLL
jgi:hypothetical protein